MGSSSSGRRRIQTKGAVEQALRLDLRTLRRLGLPQAGRSCTATLSWNSGGESMARINLYMDMVDLDAAVAVLAFCVDGVATTQRVRIDVVACRFGGHRYFFRCPVTWRRCLVLACVHGVFASRQAHRLNYAIQSLDRLGRLHRARAKARERAMGTDGRAKPRGAHRARLLQHWLVLDRDTDDLLAREATRRLGPKHPGRKGFAGRNYAGSTLSMS